jgi:isopenicillin N synthase-like dioxygenase
MRDSYRTRMTANPKASIPVIDLSADDAGQRFTAALRATSCAWVTGHQIPPALFSAIRAASLTFFDLPREEKATVQWPGSGLWRGWQPVHEGGAEYGGAVRPTELLERFEVNLSPGSGGATTQDNLWPERPAELQTTYTDYAAALHHLTSDLMALLVGELDLPEADLAAWQERQYSNLVANLYPAQDVAPASGRLRVAPHIDHGGLTVLLFDDAPGGLEVSPNGESNDWIPVAPVDGALLVQAGELLEHWTDGVLPANLHRVANPTREQAASRRLSIIFFHQPDLASVITPAPSCAPADGSTRTAVIAGDLVARRQREYREVA